MFYVVKFANGTYYRDDNKPAKSRRGAHVLTRAEADVVIAANPGSRLSAIYA